MFRPRMRRARRRTLVLLAVLATVAAGSAVVLTADATTPPHAPFGSFDSLLQNPTGFQISGWAIDPDTSGHIAVGVYINDKITTRLGATRARPDIGTRYPSYGPDHGFAGAWTEPAGSYKVCVVAYNTLAGTTNTSLGCKTITLNFNPHGAITSVTQFPGGFTATGWSVDPSSPATAVQVNLIVDGSNTPTISANATTSGLPTFVPPSGSAHGWTIKMNAAEGTHRVCLFAANVGSGSNATIGCRDVALNFSPTGAITSLTQTPGGFHVTGWAYDPDTSTPITVGVKIDGPQVSTLTANGPSSAHPGHGFDTTVLMPGTSVAPGSHNICIAGYNLGAFGHTRQVACQTITLNYNPTASTASVVQKSPGALITGWASDPDTSSPVNVIITADGKTVKTVTANLTGSSHSGHNFSALAPLPNGTHTVCATAVNLSYGSGNSSASCKQVTLNFNPFGGYEGITRSSDGSSVTIKGWAIDPDTTGKIPISVSIDSASAASGTTGVSRPDIAAKYPGNGSTMGFQITYKVNQNEHRICVSAMNVLGGNANTFLGCHTIQAVHPTPPSAPQNVTATGGYGGATVSWTAPASDGGALWTSYVVTSSPGNVSVKVDGHTTNATVVGLQPKTTYTFKVVAVNVAGSSPAGTSPAVTTQASPPPQTTPAPISTSRYIRNVSAATSTDLATMKAEGAADAKANPSGHGYLILLDIGGQDETDGGVLLSATTHLVSYGDLVKDVNAYVDGYASGQKASAPVIIALGTNNDVDVSSSAGASWANKVVDPVRSYAARYSGVTIAGADDIEPGFRGTYAATKAWLGGFLANTSAPFVNNGSADGCSWTQTNSGCNNGWSMSGLYWLSAGAAPVRIINLPQVYNNDMAAQWKYISLTGIGQNNPRINFGGALTEWTACQQTGSCGSLTGNGAWTQLWNQLQSSTALKVGSLPYSTDLRIDS